jgi:hypothetical protein
LSQRDSMSVASTKCLERTFTEFHVGKSSPRSGWRTQPRVSTLGTDDPTRRALTRNMNVRSTKNTRSAGLEMLKGRQIERTNKTEVGSNGSMSQRCALILAQQ